MGQVLTPWKIAALIIVVPAVLLPILFMILFPLGLFF
jgi:hypothetical protein